MKKIEGDWISDSRTRAVFEAIGEAGHEIFFVGGCVRNALLDQPVHDIDLATNATPDEVVRLCTDAGLRVVPTGIDHGTVTVISDGMPFEVTTYRKDIKTDGRRAEVEYSKKLEDDARRRDFTMNALYAARDGHVVDPLGGLHDLECRRVRFIEDAESRIHEDYLRILRFFRFHAWYGDAKAGMDPDALAAIAGNLEGLDRLSADRTGAEMLKLLGAPDPSTAVATMQACGALGHILPGADAKWLPLLVHFEKGAKVDAIRRLAVLVRNDPTERLRLSKKDRRRWADFRQIAETDEPPSALGYRYGADIAAGGMLVAAALSETIPRKDFRDEIERGAAAHFPVKAADLSHVFSGPELGKRLKELEARWVASGFTLSRDELLSE